MKINKGQKLYGITKGNYTSYIGFDVAERLRQAVIKWVGKDATPMRQGTKKHYNAYRNAMLLGQSHYFMTKQKCEAELTPELIGLEGKRVEVTYPDGDKSCFYVGRSTGWMPCHIEVENNNSSGGGAVYFPKGSTLRLV